VGGRGGEGGRPYRRAVSADALGPRRRRLASVWTRRFIHDVTL
jgi:hypothetical protein